MVSEPQLSATKSLFSFSRVYSLFAAKHVYPILCMFLFLHLADVESLRQSLQESEKKANTYMKRYSRLQVGTKSVFQPSPLQKPSSVVCLTPCDYPVGHNFMHKESVKITHQFSCAKYLDFGRYRVPRHPEECYLTLLHWLSVSHDENSDATQLFQQFGGIQQKKMWNYNSRENNFAGSHWNDKNQQK